MKPALLITLFAFASAIGALQAAKDDKKLAEVPKTDGTELPGGGKRWGVFSMEDAKKDRVFDVRHCAHLALFIAKDSLGEHLPYIIRLHEEPDSLLTPGQEKTERPA